VETEENGTNRHFAKIKKPENTTFYRLCDNLSDVFADWTGLEQAGLYALHAICYEGGDWVVTELRPGKRALVKVLYFL
jgi:hypothetical protein